MLDLEELIEEKVSLRMFRSDLLLIGERGNLNEETFKGNEIENFRIKKITGGGREGSRHSRADFLEPRQSADPF